MPKRVTPLTDAQVKNAKPQGKDYKITDGHGLYLLITPSGGKLWRLDYRYRNARKTLALGAYPIVSLGDARNKRNEAKKLIDAGIDPAEDRKDKKAQKKTAQFNALEPYARQWIAENKSRWTEKHAGRLLTSFERDVFPLLDKELIDVKTADLAMILQRVEKRSRETAYRLKSAFAQMFRTARQTGRIENNPAADLSGILQPQKHKHMAAPTNPKDIAPLLRAIDGFQGSFVVKQALCLAPLVFVRPGELRKAEWKEIDLETAEWNIPGNKMKMGVAHLVPLSTQAIEILRELYPLTGHGKYVFPCRHSTLQPMSENTINASLRRLGFEKEEITGHGFRAMARTVLDEVLKVRPDIIEHQLAHAVRDPNGRAYNRTAFLDDRRDMMQLWADYLDGLKKGATVLPIKMSA